MRTLVLIEARSISPACSKEGERRCHGAGGQRPVARVDGFQHFVTVGLLGRTACGSGPSPDVAFTRFSARDGKVWVQVSCSASGRRWVRAWSHSGHPAGVRVCNPEHRTPLTPAQPPPILPSSIHPRRSLVLPASARSAPTAAPLLCARPPCTTQPLSHQLPFSLAITCSGRTARRAAISSAIFRPFGSLLLWEARATRLTVDRSPDPRRAGGTLQDFHWWDAVLIRCEMTGYAGDPNPKSASGIATWETAFLPAMWP